MLGQGLPAQGPRFLGHFHPDVGDGWFAEHEVVGHVVVVSQLKFHLGVRGHRETFLVVPHPAPQRLDFYVVVDFFESLVCLNSTAEDGRWFDITQRLQNLTVAGKPYFTSSTPPSASRKYRFPSFSNAGSIMLESVIR